MQELEENNRIVKRIDLFKKMEIPGEHFMQIWAQLRTEKSKT